MNTNTSAVMNAMLSYFGSDVRRINHALKVYAFAQAIAGGEGLAADTAQTLDYAALLHDIGIHEAERKYDSTAGNYQEIEGPPIARKILAGLNVDPEVIDRACFLVGHHHSYGLIDGSDFRILVEADFIVNAFEDGMDRKMIEILSRTVFATETGKSLLAEMYLT